MINTSKIASLTKVRMLNMKKRASRKLIPNCISGWQLLTQSHLSVVYPILPKKASPRKKFFTRGWRSPIFSRQKRGRKGVSVYQERGRDRPRPCRGEGGISLNRQDSEALDDSIYFAANIAYPGGIEAAADAAAAAALTELRFVK